MSISVLPVRFKRREAREWFFKNYIVETLEDSRRIAPPGTESGALAMMVWTYWEQVGAGCQPLRVVE